MPALLQTISSFIERRRLQPWFPVLWVALMLGIGFFPVLKALVHEWQTNEDMAHGMFVPLLAGYIVWERRHSLLGPGEIPRSGCTLGLLLMLWGAIQLCIGVLGAELFMQRTAFLISFCGAILYLAGTRILRALTFPILMLLFMIPPPGILLKSVTFPLQLLSTRLAESSLDLFGLSVVREGNILELAGQQLSVVEACSGIRFVLSLSFFSLCYAYLNDCKTSLRLLLLAFTFGVAILANAGRIVVTAIIGEYDQALASGFFHSAEGWVIFITSIALLMVIHKLLTKIDSMAHHAV